MEKPTLLILAAGMSSRYKTGLKQLDAFGPSGETLLDYALYDAIQAGFGKTIFVIRKQTKNDFERLVTKKYGNKIEYDFVFQEIDDLPAGFDTPVSRQKPWGTGHAVWVARDKIKEPFAVINADDFYGSESYRILTTFLKEQNTKVDGKYSMVGFNLQNTLSDYGSVARGICKVSDGYLLEIDERTNIQKQDGLPIYITDDGAKIKLDPQAVVSMNFWGFSADIFPRMEYFFKAFLKDNIDNVTSEFFLPNCIKDQIKTQNVTVEVLNSSSKWIGVTYPDDRKAVQDKLKSFVDAGLYPTPLF